MKKAVLSQCLCLPGFIFLFFVFSGTTYVIRENGAEVGRWEEPDGHNETKIVENNKSVKKSSDTSSPLPEEAQKQETNPQTTPPLESQKIEPSNKKDEKSPLLRAMRAVAFIKVTVLTGRIIKGQNEEIEMLGSGVIINAHGTMVTNYHVVKGARKMSVILYNENDKGDRDPHEHEATVLKTNEYYDLAVVSVHAETPDYLQFADFDKIHVGDEVQAIGNPSGLQVTVSKGIISSIRTNKQMKTSYQDLPEGSMSTVQFENITWIQTDAAINPGNSGGPLLNKDFQIVGVNSFKFTSTEGLNFALHAKHIKSYVSGYLPNA